MTISYDQEADVLYISFVDGDYDCEYLENKEGIVLRLDRSTNRICGVTIISFLTRITKNGEIGVPEVDAILAASSLGSIFGHSLA